MKTKRPTTLLAQPPVLLLLAILHFQLSTAFAQGTAFTYQGRLTSNGTNYTGNAEFQPTLWDALSGGAQVAAHSPSSLIVGVTNGLFVLPLDFGESFSGANRWLQLEVRTTIGSFTPLTPRQPITPTPYAITAGQLSGLLPAAQLSGALPSANLGGTYSGAVTFNNPASSFSGSAAGLTALNASQLASGTVPDARLAASVARTNQVWLLGGNRGTTPGTQFLGTADDRALEFKVNGQRALRLEPNPDGPNVIGGASGNYIRPGSLGSTIGGGGGFGTTNAIFANSATIAGGRANVIDFNAYDGTIGGGYSNHLETLAGYAVIAGGEANLVGAESSHAAIGGGQNNRTGDRSSRAVIAGGEANDIGANCGVSTIGGGYLNRIAAHSAAATIAGGIGNDIGTNAYSSAIGGGNQNYIGHDSEYATIGGGFANALGTNADYAALVGGLGNRIGTNSGSSAIGGGWNNKISDNAQFATIPGGRFNRAASYAFAAGYFAEAHHQGAFVWADSQGRPFGSTADNQFLIRAAGGVGVNTNNPNGVALNVHGTVAASGFSGAGSGLTGLSASQLTSGTISDSRLSANVARLNNAQTFTGEKTFRNSGDNGGSLRVGANAAGAEPKFVYFGDSDYVRIGESGADDRMELRAAEFSFRDGLLRLNDNKMHLRGGSDMFHGLGWYPSGGFAGANPDGPVLFGFGGGALGTTSGGEVIALMWNQSGRVGVGRSPAANRLEVEGTASKTVAGSWLANSDARIKTGVTTLTNALDTLNRVRLVSFRYTDQYRAAHPGIEDRPYLNVVAQEFQQVFPDAVQGSGETLPDGSEILQVDTYPLTIYSAAAIQELNQKLEHLTADLKRRDAENAELKQRLERLELLLARLGAPER